MSNSYVPVDAVGLDAIIEACRDAPPAGESWPSADRGAVHDAMIRLVDNPVSPDPDTPRVGPVVAWRTLAGAVAYGALTAASARVTRIEKMRRDAEPDPNVGG